MTTAKKKNPGLGAHQDTLAAALAVAKEPESEGTGWEGEPTKGISVRLPMSLYKRVSTLSLQLRHARGAEKKERDAADPLSMHGLILTALAEYLEREAP